MRVVKQWHRLPREVGDVASLETFKVIWDRAMSNLVYMKMALVTAVELEQMAFKGQFLPEPLCDSMGQKQCYHWVQYWRVEGVVDEHPQPFCLLPHNSSETWSSYK